METSIEWPKPYEPGAYERGPRPQRSLTDDDPSRRVADTDDRYLMSLHLLYLCPFIQFQFAKRVTSGERGACAQRLDSAHRLFERGQIATGHDLTMRFVVVVERTSDRAYVVDQ